MPSTEDVVEVTCARLEEQLASARTVYRRAVPTPHDDAYIVVRSNVGETTSSNLADAIDTRGAIVWVTSVSRSDDAETAAREAFAASVASVRALAGWRPDVGQVAWRYSHTTSLPIQRDDSLPDTVFYGVDQFLLQYQPA